MLFHCSYHIRFVQGFVRGQSSSAQAVIATLARQSLGGPAIGVAFAVCLVLYIRLPFVQKEPVLITSASILAAYSCFFVAEDILSTSGILAVVALGMAIALFAARFVQEDTVLSLLQTW